MPVLRLYKLNGCAIEYRRYRASPSICDSILLTERQLQSHKSNPWKRDLLRDRLRSNSLLLCGFGNDEPQVRFLTLEIFNEFQRDGASEESGLEGAVWCLPNAPYINVYRKLTFPQLQVLEGFLNAHQCSIPHNGGEHSGNIFYGKDAHKLVHGTANKKTEEKNVKDEDKLSADLFWKRFFQGAYQRLLRRNVRQGSSFYSWLDANSVYPQPWANYLLDELYDHEEDKGDKVRQLFGRPRWQDRLTLDHTMGPRPLPWMRIVQSTMPASAAVDGATNWYLPILEAPLTIPATLLVLILLDYHEDNGAEMHGVEGEGFRLSVKDESIGQSLPIAVMQSTMADEAVVKTPFVGSKLSFRITIPDITGLNSEQRWSHIEDNKNNSSTTLTTLKVGRERSVSLSHIIKRLSTPKQVTKQRVIDVVKESMWEDDEEHPVKKRLRRLQVEK